MKTSAPKVHSSNPHSSTPFLPKSNEGTFFSRPAKLETPFLSPSSIQPQLNTGRHGNNNQLLGHQITNRHAGTQIMRSGDNPAENAQYPNVDEQQRISEIFDPQQTESAQAGGTVPPVSNPAGFRRSMKQRINQYINRVLPSAEARQNSSVELSLPTVKSLGDVAQRESTQFYGDYLRVAVHSAQEGQRRANVQMRDRLHLVSERASEARLIACNWVASRMDVKGGDIIRNYHVLASVSLAKQACSARAQQGTGSGNTRDQALFNSVRDEILNDRQADLRTMMINQASFAQNKKAFIQSRIAPRSNESQQNTRRRGRWETLGTVIHEMMHIHAHENFSNAASNIEEANIAVEGFAEYFARPVYSALRTRARSDNTLRTSIEGVQEPFRSDLAPERSGGGYQHLVDKVNEIKSILGGNEESLKAAFFLGRLEFIGLGGWNAQEAARRNEERYAGNQLGLALLMTTEDGSISDVGFRIRYGRIVYGRSGPFQVTLGGNINYLRDGNRFGVGGSLGLQYNWPNVYVRAGVDAGASTAPGQSVRLDLMPGVEAGVNVGVVRVGVGATLLIPIAGGPADERVMRMLPSLGASFVF